MAIGYLKKRQKVNHNGEVKEVYLAKVCYSNYVDLDRLADDVSKMCSASPADVLMHVRALEQCIGWHLAHSNVVKLDSLGTFYPSILKDHQMYERFVQDTRMYYNLSPCQINAKE